MISWWKWKASWGNTSRRGHLHQHQQAWWCPLALAFRWRRSANGGRDPREASPRDKYTTVTIPGVVPPTPVIVGSSLGHLNLSKLVSSPAFKDSPILVQSSPSYELSLSTSPVSPAFTTLSMPILPILMTSPALPPVSSPSSDRDPVPTKGSPQLLEPPPLTRALLDEYVPAIVSWIDDRPSVTFRGTIIQWMADGWRKLLWVYDWQYGVSRLKN